MTLFYNKPGKEKLIKWERSIVTKTIKQKIRFVLLCQYDLVNYCSQILTLKWDLKNTMSEHFLKIK